MLRDWPLWLLAAVALCLSVFVAVPTFRDLADAAALPWILFATIAAWIFAGARSTAPILAAVRTRQSAAAIAPFVVTAVEARCEWGGTRQTEGWLATQVSGIFMVKNRGAAPLHLITARIVRPRVAGEVLADVILIQSQNRTSAGKSVVSGHFIPAGSTLPVMVTVQIRGAPKQRSGQLSAALELIDSDNHRQRVRFTARCLTPPVTQ